MSNNKDWRSIIDEISKNYKSTLREGDYMKISALKDSLEILLDEAIKEDVEKDILWKLEDILIEVKITMEKRFGRCPSH
jgi:hypothetical protein